MIRFESTFPYKSEGTFGAKNNGITLFDGIFEAKNFCLTLLDGTFGAKNIGLTQS